MLSAIHGKFKASSCDHIVDLRLKKIAGITGIRQEIKGQIVNCIQDAQSSQAKAVRLIGADDMDKGDMKDALIRAKEASTPGLVRAVHI